jgi:hypothetical protein
MFASCLIFLSAVIDAAKWLSAKQCLQIHRTQPAWISTVLQKLQPFPAPGIERESQWRCDLAPRKTDSIADGPIQALESTK